MIMEVREIVCEGMDWIHVALVNMVQYFWVT
jgi:hypothetical protein